MKKRSFFQRVMVALNLFFSFCLFLACIVPYTTSASLAFISLAVPLLVLINMLFFLYWSVQKRILLLLPFSILVFGYFTLGPFIAFNGPTKANNETGQVSVMTFNSLGFMGRHNELKSTAGDTIVKFIRNEDPDLICFQEFDYKKIRSHNFDDYPYKYVDYEFGVYSGRVVQAIYSKYKISKKGRIEFPNSSNSAIFADIIIKSDTIRLYNLHLQSLSIRPSNLKKERSDKLFGRLRNSFEKQLNQSEMVRKHMNSSPYKNIVCGDFNNNQFSRVYFNIKGNLKDSFLEKGNYYGQTINFWRFPFRIDFILVDPSVQVLSHKNYSIKLSDHEPVMASFKVGANK